MTRHRTHLGITLIEVMMSTMVVSLGILGLVALIPLGTHLTERGVRADRIASVGPRAFHEARARGAFAPANWVIPTAALASTNSPFWLAQPTGLPVRQPYLIDPMFFGANGFDSTRRYFPYPTQLYGSGAPNYRQTTSKEMQMWRVGLRRSGGNAPLSAPQAIAAFRSDDDLAFERPDDGELPSFQRFYERSATPVKRQALGEYSWMIMLTPSAVDQSNFSTTGLAATPNVESEWFQPPVTISDVAAATGAPGNRPERLLAAMQTAATDEYMASVIILKNRQIPGLVSTPLATPSLTDGDDELEVTSERVVGVDTTSFLAPGGYSTGEVRLIQSGGSREDAEERILKLSNGDWICLVRRLPEDADFPLGDIYQWYKVVMVDDVVDSTDSITGNSLPFSRRVTINGPDWNSNVPPTHAIIVDGVVGVYTKRVRLETQSPWSP
ncbi:type IV pilus modification PilV family protein [Bremerella sp. P1]|uniref:type IV pilus modification PilV family protein n=1 Tax=Bremerella sp. P1 TaxID=3026424 RepID=UPI0023679392|nr:hypothetical protein [Bremerella sp. P1]WDI40930.1 hypothetical protein PSR63_20900 [Bremerella sp. P1]